LNVHDALAKTLDKFACLIAPAIRERQVQDFGVAWIADERPRDNRDPLLPDESDR
jgi:hypothetical protein